MAVLDKKVLWGFLLMLTGAVGVGVNYPAPVCSVTGSTVTLPCTFTPLKFFIQNGRAVSIEIIRVVWCQNDEFCQFPAPSVFDSSSQNNNPRYKYLGDKKGNCTLQITDVQKKDEATFRFRMEANDDKAHFTGQPGVRVTVSDVQMQIKSSRGDGELRSGENITLYCTALCTFHQLEVTWFRDGHALSESGPALHIIPLTARDSGKYTCGLKASVSSLSLPYSLKVEAEGAVGVGVNYPAPVCAVTGSTVTLPCTFTPLKFFIQNGREVLIEIIRVIWASVSSLSLPYSLKVEAEGAVGVGVNYPAPVCAVTGSTVTLPCTFTPLKFFIQNGREVLIEIIRVIWCRNHQLCQGSTPSVFDSSSQNNNPRYKYLGDKKGNCTLQITDVQKEDEASLRFRMEADYIRAHFTGPPGVNVTVSDVQMQIKSSRGDRELRRGETVTLYCTALCTFHQLEVTWYRDGHALSESGPALQLGPLTAGDSGNYTCGLKTSSSSSLSLPYSLQVEEEVDPLLIVRLVLFTLHSVLIVIAASIIIRRTCVQESSCSSRELKNATMQPPDSDEQL
ncbi:obscurin-like [Micropterus dolomieu]|uniref:obscurin-like n=1 Tax=Micropterus dolomieu TaxID=147949 RepID=UPI001E8E0FA9|nr:obscurin-like [Micropterus dolomieu]